MEKVRVLFVCPGPTVKDWSALARELSYRIDDFHLAVPKYAVSRLVDESLQMPIHSIAALPLGKISGHVGLDVWDHVAVQDLVRRLDPTVIHVMGEASYVVTFQFSRTVSRSGPHVTCRAAQNVYQEWPFPIARLERLTLGSVSEIYSLSQAAARVLRQKGYAGIVEPLPNGYDSSLFYVKDREPNDVLTIGYVGSLYRRKGVMYLLEALGSLKDMEWQAIIVGSGPLETTVREDVTRNGLDGRVRIVPRLPRAQLAEIYRQLDVLVVPSVSTDGSDFGPGRWIPSVRIGWKEQFGRVLVEAMACGVPSIGTTCGAIPEVIGEAGWVVPERSSGAIAETLSRLIANRKEIDRMRVYSRIRASAFSWGAVAEQLAARWRDLVSRGGSVAGQPAKSGSI